MSRPPGGRSAAVRPDRTSHRTPAAEQLLRDRLRQVVVAMAAASGLLGLQALATRSAASADEMAGGALAGDATVLSSASPAPVWLSITGLALILWAAWQLHPSTTSSRRQRGAGWWMAGATALMTLWLVLVEMGWLWGSVVALVGTTVCLERVVRALDRVRPQGRLEAVVVDGIPGAFLGWCLVACPSAALAAASPPLDPRSQLSEALGVVALAAVGLLAGWLVLRSGRLAVALGAIWGLLLVATARLTLGPESVVVVAIALASVAKCAAAFVLARRRRRVAPSSA